MIIDSETNKDSRNKGTNLGNAKAKSKRRISLDQNSVRYFLDIVNRLDSMQRAVARIQGEVHRHGERVSRFEALGLYPKLLKILCADLDGENNTSRYARSVFERAGLGTVTLND
jgi:hypothetical protein